MTEKPHEPPAEWNAELIGAAFEVLAGSFITNVDRLHMVRDAFTRIWVGTASVETERRRLEELVRKGE